MIEVGWRVLNAALGVVALAVVIWRARQVWPDLSVRIRLFAIALLLLLLNGIVGSVESLASGIPLGWRTATLTVALGWVLVGGLARRKDKT